MTDELIPLDTWIARRYPVRPPSIHTVRKWARDGKLYPAPQKHGRGYYIQPSAEYLSNEGLVRRLSDSTATQ